MLIDGSFWGHLDEQLRTAGWDLRHCPDLLAIVNSWVGLFCCMAAPAYSVLAITWVGEEWASKGSMMKSTISLTGCEVVAVCRCVCNIVIVIMFVIA